MCCFTNAEKAVIVRQVSDIIIIGSDVFAHETF